MTAATVVIRQTRRAQASRIALACCAVLIALMTASAPARAAENWNPAVNMGPVINSPSTEKAPEISPDGLTLYFSHNSPQGDINIFYSQWDGSAWGPPIDIGEVVNSSRNDWGPTLAGDGNTMYFASDRPGGYGGYDIYVTRRVGGVWQPPQNVGPTINSNVGELGQDTNPEETVLWFVRGWPESRPTDEDIFYSLKVGGQWTTPVQWELNTPYLEDNPDISPDGNKLYFTAIYDTLYGGGYGSFDIWVSERVGGVWQTPVNLGPNINTQYHDANPSISSDENTLYFTRQAPDGYGGFDLYWATRIPPSPGDFDDDGDVDLADFAQFENCFTGPGGTIAPGCEPGDFDLDNDIDCDDWAQFVPAWTGPGAPPEQADTDLDGRGNMCDNCPDVANATQTDDDADGRGNACDNCRLVANNSGAGAQADSDNDGFGNRCDGDLSNNGSTNAQDTSMFRLRLGQPSVPPVFNAADINANGVVNAQDTSIFRTLLGAPPGPGAGP